MKPKFKREAAPDNPHAPFDGTVYGVFVDGERIGQVWQIAGTTWHTERAMGHKRIMPSHVIDWTWTDARGECVSTRAEAAGMLVSTLESDQCDR